MFRISLFNFLFSGIAILYFSSCASRAEKEKNAVHITESRMPVSAKVNTPVEDSLYTIEAVGDLVLGTSYPDSSCLPDDNGKCFFNSVQEILSPADITIGNLEGPLLDRGGKPKACNVPKYCYTFRMPQKYSSCLSEAGFDLLNLANNHSHDFGYSGADTTCKVLRGQGIGYAGFRTDSAWIIKRGDVSYGFLAFAPYYFTIDLNNIARASALVKELSSKVDIVIVYMHGGAEGAEFRHVTREAEYQFGTRLGDVYHFAHTMIDSGADVIFGAGPHVLRGMEVYRNRSIFYSLGNFCTYGKVNITGYGGISGIARVKVRKDGSFSSGQFIPVKLIGKGIPVPDKDSSGINALQQLSAEDFPESEALITADGSIVKRDSTAQFVINKPATAMPPNPHPTPSLSVYHLVAASFPDIGSAEKYCNIIKKKGLPAIVLRPAKEEKHFRVSAFSADSLSTVLQFKKQHIYELPEDAWVMKSGKAGYKRQD